MARLPRLSAPGAVHYLVQRAVAGRVLFIDAEDVALFTRLLEAACRQYGFALHAYALTPFEVHLLGTPAGADAPAAVFQAIGRAFVPSINRKTGRAGALWERRYRSTIVDPDLVVAVMQIIEARAAHSSVDGTSAAWTSRAHHVGTRQDSLVTDHARYWALSDAPFGRQAIYRDLSAVAPEPTLVDRVHRAVEHGWAIGSPVFLSTLEQVATRRAVPLKRGRPRKLRL